MPSKHEIEEWIRIGNEAAIVPHLVEYIKSTERPLAAQLVEMALTSNDPYFVAEVVKCLSYKNFQSDRYSDLLKLGLNWPHPDFADSVLLASLNRIPYYFSVDEEVRELLQPLSAHGNPVVRDAVAEVIQVYLGSSPNLVIRSTGAGDLLESIDPKFKAWLST